jgi:hypothetical protein
VGKKLAQGSGQSATNSDCCPEIGPKNRFIDPALGKRKYLQMDTNNPNLLPERRREIGQMKLQGEEQAR